MSKPHQPAAAAPDAPVARPRRDRTHYLYLAVVVAVLAGIVLGLAAPGTAKELKPLGTGFVSLITMMISPIIFCTIVLGIGSVRKAAKVGAVGGLALLYFLVMSTVALAIGLVVGNLLHPLQHSDAAYDRPTWAAAHVVILLSLPLLLLGWPTLHAELVRGGQRGLTTAATALTVIGYVGVASTLLVEAYVAPTIGHAAMQRLEDGGMGVTSAALGLCMVAVGFAFSLLAVHEVPSAGTGWATFAPLLLAGVGSGLVITPNQTVTLSEVPVPRAGTAGGLLQTGQRIGAAVGIAAVGAVFFAEEAGSGDYATAYQHGILVALAFVVAALLVACVDIVVDRASGTGRHALGRSEA